MYDLPQYKEADPEIKNVFKLSQNRDVKSYNNIIDKQKGQGAEAEKIAAEMKKRRP